MMYIADMSRYKALFAFSLAVVLIGSVAHRYLGSGKTPQSVDFYVYYFTAQVVHDNPKANLYAVAAGENPQTRSAPINSDILAHAKAAGFDDVGMYLYPPLLADLFAPISWIHPHLAAALWRLCNMTFVIASVFLLARMLRVPVVGFEFVALALAAFSFFPIYESLWDGQITILLLALWMIGIVAYMDRYPVLSAMVFALATAFKVTPILLLPLFLIWKDRRWVVSYIAASLGLVGAMVAINGVQSVYDYHQVVASMGDGIPYVWNKTIGSLVAWAYYGKVFLAGAADVMTVPPAILSITAKAASGIFYLICVYCVWRSRHQDRATRGATIAVFGIAIMCVSPVSWRYGYCVAFIALAIYWVKALRSSVRTLQLVLLTLVTCVVGCSFVDLAAQSHLPRICQIFLAGLWVASCALFSVDALFRTEEDFGLTKVV